MDANISKDFVKSFANYKNDNDSIVTIGNDIFAIVDGEALGPFPDRVTAISKSVEFRQNKIDNVISNATM